MANEKRLIDANVLKTLFDVRYDTAFIQERTRENKEPWNGYCAGINWGRNTIAAAPTVDAVEVVRCKDCIYAKNNYLVHGLCLCEKPMHHVVHGDRPKNALMCEDDFCSYGERKDNDRE